MVKVLVFDLTQFRLESGVEWTLFYFNSMVCVLHNPRQALGPGP